MRAHAVAAAAGADTEAAGAGWPQEGNCVSKSRSTASTARPHHHALFGRGGARVSFARVDILIYIYIYLLCVPFVAGVLSTLTPFCCCCCCCSLYVQTVPLVIADADDSSSLAAMAAGTDVIISTAGNTAVTLSVGCHSSCYFTVTCMDP